MTRSVPESVERLYSVAEGRKAEIVDGTILVLERTGDAPGYAAGEIFASLREYVRRTRRGRALGDNVGFLMHLAHRQSFSPDAAYYVGPPAGMKFFQGAPQFAAEIRSECDYGPAAETAMAAKRADYFAAGTQVVWDVDLLGDDVVRVYRAADATRSTVYRRGQAAEAEPAVPGWSLRVDDLFA
jgi:Uma2 family endonuclease